MSKLYAFIDTERNVKTKTIPANREMRIRINYGSAEHSLEAFDLVIRERQGNFPFLDIQTASKYHIVVNGETVHTDHALRVD